MLSQTQIALHSIITLVVRSKFKHVSKEAELRAQLRTLDNLYRTCLLYTSDAADER